MGGGRVEASWSEDIEVFVEKIRSTLPVESIIIFGSYAKDQHGNWSDIDVLIISDYFKDVSILDRFKILQEFKVGRIEPFTYTYEELCRMVDKGNPLALNALIEGNELMASPRIKELMSKAKSTYEKKGRMWIIKL